MIGAFTTFITEFTVWEPYGVPFYTNVKIVKKIL